MDGAVGGEGEEVDCPAETGCRTEVGVESESVVVIRCFEKERNSRLMSSSEYRCTLINQPFFIEYPTLHGPGYDVVLVEFALLLGLFAALVRRHLLHPLTNALSHESSYRLHAVTNLASSLKGKQVHKVRVGEERENKVDLGVSVRFEGSSIRSIHGSIGMGQAVEVGSEAGLSDDVQSDPCTIVVEVECICGAGFEIVLDHRDQFRRFGPEERIQVFDNPRVKSWKEMFALVLLKQSEQRLRLCKGEETLWVAPSTVMRPSPNTDRIILV